MKHEGKYIYGIIATDEAPNFGPIGIGGRNDEVTTIGAKGISAIVSNSSMDHYVLSRENLKAHTRVIEKIFESYTVLPMRFCTVAETVDTVISFLETNAEALKHSLEEIDGKVEIDIKVSWKEIKKIYEEIVSENKRIHDLRTKGARDRNSLIHAGELVATALEEKKAVEKDRYLSPLKKAAYDCKESETSSDEMLAHASFLVDKTWLPEFDAQVEALNGRYGNRIVLHYVGPMAPFSFVNLKLHWEE